MRLLAFALAVLTAFSVLASTGSDSVKVYFHVGHRQFDPSLGNNRSELERFIAHVREAEADGTLEEIVVRAYASPEGPDRLNQQLSVKGCDVIADYIMSHTGINPSLIKKEPGGVAWSELRRLVADNPDVPSRAKVLDILDNTPVKVFDKAGKLVDSRKKQLMELDRGVPYRWMLANLFPQLRNAVAVLFFINTKEELHVEEPELLKRESMETSEGINLPEPEQEPAPAEPEDEPATEPEETPAEEGEEDVVNKPFVNPYLLALKTNLLYYPLLLPNLELEWRINKHWSVAVEGNLAWWGSYRKERSYRLVILDGEARYWIKPRADWHGLYAGVIAGGGWYDIEKGDPGKYGEGLMTGLSVGYMWPIRRHLSLEAEVGFGYMYTRYKEYRNLDGHHLYLRTKDLNYFGPIKAKFSLVWRFMDARKPKKTEPAE